MGSATTTRPRGAPRLALLALLLAACGDGSGGGGASPLLTLAHVNDTHAHLEATTTKLELAGAATTLPLGGFPRLAARLARLRAERPDALFLHAGDVFQGTLYFTRYHGLASLALLEAMGLDAMCLGNHEFDRGPATLADFAAQTEFPLLSANTDISAEPGLAGQVAPWAVLTAGGARVGVIGLTTPDTAESSQPGPAITFTDPVTAARDAVAALTAEGIDRIVALTHLGLDADRVLARQVSGIDVIVGGHSHSLLGDVGALGLTPVDGYPRTETSPAGEPVLVVQAWCHSRLLGLLEVTFDARGVVTGHTGGPVLLAGAEFQRPDATGDLAPVDDATRAAIEAAIAADPAIEVVAEDPATLAALEDYAAPLDEFRHEQVATAAEDLRHVRIPGSTHTSGAVLPGGSEVAPRIADSMLWQAARTHLAATIAVINGGAPRQDIAAGPITVGDVYELMPFGNTLVQLQLTGAKLVATLDAAVSRALVTTGGAYPYVAGLRYTADAARPEGQRIVTVETGSDAAGWTALADGATYSVLLISYLAAGGDGYDLLAEITGARYDTGFVDAEIFLDYVASLGTLTRQTEQRVTLLNAP